MNREEAIEYWEQFNAEIDGLYDACSDADRDVLVKQREIVEYTISALRQQEHFRDVTKKVEPLTNAQKIRSMSDEELAWFLHQVGYEHRWGLKEYALEWLQQPCEGGE